MAEGGIAPEIISPQQKEALPAKENVIVSLKSGAEIMKATPPPETDFEGKERWQYQMLEIEERLKGIENGGKGTKIVELKRKNGNPLKPQEEGIPVDALLRSLTQKIDDPTTSRLERIRILKIRADLAPHWKEYHRLPNRRGNIRYDARIDYEVEQMQKDGRSTGDLQKDQDKAQQILNDRKELFIPDPDSDPPPKEEKFTVGIVDYTQMRNKKAEDVTQTQLTELLHMKKWWSPKEWFRVTKLRVGEQYYRELWTQRAKDLFDQVNNPFAKIDVVKNVIIDANHDRESHLEQQKSTVTRFIKTEAKERGFVRTGEEVMTSQDQAINQRVNALFSRFARGEIDESQFKTEQDQFFVELKNNPATAALFKDCDMYADNLLEVAKAVKQQYKAHKNLLNNLDHLVTVQLGNASLYAKTEQSVRLADKFVRWCQTSRFTGRGWLANPATAGLMFGLGVYGVGQIAGWGARTAMAVPVAGSAAGALFAGIRRWSELKVDFAMNERDIAVSRNVTGKPRREALKKYSYDKKSTNELKNQVQDIKTLSLETDQRKLARSIAEIEIRSDFSEENHVDLITYESGAKTETNRLELLEAMDEAKSRLIRAGVNRDQLNIWLNESRAQWRQTFTQNKEQQDKAFAIYKTRNAAGAAAASAMFGLGIGFGIQEGLAETARHFPDTANLPVVGGLFKTGQTAAEKAVNWAATQAGHPEIGAPPVSMESLRNLYPTGGKVELGNNLQAIISPDHAASIVDKATAQTIGTGNVSPDGSLHFAGDSQFTGSELDNKFKASGFITNEIDNPTTKPSILSGIKEAAAQQRVETFQSGNIHGVFDGVTGKVSMVDDVSKMAFTAHFSADGIFSLDHTENPTIDFDKAKEFLAAAGFTNISEHQEAGGNVIDHLLNKSSEELKAQGIIETDNVKKAWNFHVLRPDIVSATGNHTHNELTLHLNQYLDENGRWLTGKNGIVNFGGDIKGDLIPSHLAGVSAQHDQVLDTLIAHNGAIQHQDMVHIIELNDGRQIMLAADQIGNSQLPNELYDSNTGELKGIKEIASAVLEKKDGGILRASELLNTGQVPEETTVHSLASIRLDTVTPEGPPVDILQATPPDISEITHNYVFDAIPPEVSPEAPPIIPIPIGFRHPLENMLILYGYGAHSEESLGWVNRDNYETRRSKRLTENPYVKLDESTEVEDYLNRMDTKYREELEQMDKTIGIPMENQSRTVITVPAFGEGKIIYKTLAQFLNQKDKKGNPIDPSLFEIIVFENDTESRPKDETEKEIQRFKADHPELKVYYAYKRWRPEDIANGVNTVGNGRRYNCDLALLRSNKRTTKPGDLIIINNDADLEGITPKYIASVIDEFDTKDETDAVVGKRNLPEWALNKPNIRAGQRLWETFDSVMRHTGGGDEMTPSKRRRGWPGMIGENSAMRASIYAAVGGYGSKAKLAEDQNLGDMMRVARNYDDRRFEYLNRLQTIKNPRRYLTYMVSGKPIIEMYNDYHENKDIRDLDNKTLLSRISNSFDIGRFQLDADAVYQKKADYGHFKDDEFDLRFKRTMDFMGVEYKIENNHVIITNATRLTEALKRPNSNFLSFFPKKKPSKTKTNPTVPTTTASTITTP